MNLSALNACEQDEGHHWRDLQCGICMFDDVLEFACVRTPQWALVLHERIGRSLFVPRVLAGIQDPMPEVRQAASYGVGMMAASRLVELVPYCLGLLLLLLLLLLAMP